MQKEMFRSNKAQVTIFVIIAVVIIAAAGAYLLIRNGVSSGFLSTEFQPIKSEIESCTSSLIRDVIWFEGFQGGYYNVPNPKQAYLSIEVPILFEKGIAKIPSPDILKEQLSSGIKDNIFICRDKLKNFESQGYNLSFGAIKSISVNFQNGKVNVELDMPISISYNNKKTVLDTFTSSTVFDYEKKQEIISYILKEQEKYPKEIIPESLITHGVENNYTMESFQLTNSTYIFSFIFDGDKYKNESYIYSFGSIL
jgi:hypothetical protein